MSLQSQFNRELDELFRRRTILVRREVGAAAPGPKPKLTRRRVRERLDDLEDIAHAILIRRIGRDDFRRAVDHKRRWHPKKGKGYGIHAKKASFRTWYDSKIASPNCVYVFWSRKPCEYVGPTIRGRGRPAGHLEKFWFGRVTRIDIHVVPRASEVPKVECLAIDMFKPRRNRMRSARKPYARRCPVCTRSRRVRRELRSVFRLRV